MNTIGKSLAMAGLIGVAGLTFGATPAHAQFGLGIATPGFSLGVGQGAGYGYYGGGYPVVAAPVVVAPPIYGPRPYYGGFGPRPYYGPAYVGGYRGYPGGYPGGFRGGYGPHYRR